MRIALACLLAAGLAVSAFAQDSNPATAPAAPALTAQPVTPPAPKGMPVPDGPAVKTTELEGGLIVEDIKIGEGYEIKSDSAMVAHYHGTLKNGGGVVDSSYERSEPMAFPLSIMIDGWKKGVPGMKVGGIRKLTIPAVMAYGDQARSEKIPPNSDLIFVIEVVDALQFEDVKVGEGDAATGQFVAVTTHTIKAGGAEVEKVDASKPYVWIPNEFMAMQLGIEGMKVGGKRKFTHVPKEMNKSDPRLQTARPGDVALEMEVELIALRNLPSQRGR